MRLGWAAIITLIAVSTWTSVWADTTSGSFQDLEVMEEKAAHDRNQRAVAVIRYVRQTPLGTRFAVDTESKSVEVEVVLMDEKKMVKPLETRSDQKLLVDYHVKVKKYAEAYYEAVAKVRSGKVKEAGEDFDGLANRFPEHATAFRGKAAVYLVSGEAETALVAASKASVGNPNDPVARSLWGVALLKTGNVAASMNEKAIVRDLDPKSESINSWEVALVRSKNAALYQRWSGLQ